MWTLAGVTGAAGMTAAQAMRGKNDPITWFIGGFSGGMAFSAASRDWRTGVVYGLLSGTIMSMLKITGDYGYPYTKQLHGTWENRRVPFYRLVDDDGRILR